jgi:hypothetical protein
MRAAVSAVRCCGAAAHCAPATPLPPPPLRTQGLPLPSDARNLYLQIDNEVDLCYEWWCNPGEPNPLPYATTASEYAHMLTYVTAAIRSLGSAKHKIGAAGLSPGATVTCGCCGQANCPGDAGGITGLTFIDAMRAAVPGVFAGMDFLASHSYPADGIGYGFNVPYAQVWRARRGVGTATGCSRRARAADVRVCRRSLA